MVSRESTGTRRTAAGPWDGDPPALRAARDRLIEAASTCIATEGLANVSVAAVAAGAGVSRQTVYRYFAGRDDLVAAALFSASDRLRGEILDRLRHLADPADQVVEALVWARALILDDPVLSAIGDPTRNLGVSALTFTEVDGIEWTEQTLRSVGESAGWAPAEAAEAFELILRVFMSLIFSPKPERTDEQLRAFLYRRLIPGLGLDVDEEL